MATSKLLGLVFCYLAAFDAVTATYEYVYEFGVRKGGFHTFDKEGQINLFQYTTRIYVQIPRNTRASYVRVVVYAVSPPKVDFNEQSNVLSITYSWIQIPISSYYVAVKAVSTIPMLLDKTR